MLIAHYPLNGDATDYFGNDGTSTNVTWVDGKIGQAGSFNGTSSSIDTGYKISDFIGDISICGWIKCNDLSERNPLVGADTSGVKPQVSIDGVENSVNAMFNNDTNQYYVSSSAYSYVLSKPANSYTHVCATYRDEVPKLYVDGNEYTLTLGGTGGDPTTSTPITIGKGFRGGVTRYANAVIDDVRIYDHALSEKEVSNISKPTNALWKMTHASLSDSTANLPDLIPVNSPALGGDALFGEVWDFDTTLDQGFGTGSNFPNITNDAAFSLSAWINLRSVSVDDIVPEAFAIVGHAGSTGFGMQVLVDKINFGARSTSNFSGNISIVLGEWTHVACTREVGGLCRIYINGVLDVTSNNNLDVGSPSEEVEVGSATTRLSSFDGQIAYVGIYSDTLTSEQIKEDYKTGLSIDNIGNIHGKYFKEGFPYLSALDSATNNWPVAAASGYNNTTAESDPCSGALTFEDAVAHAEAQGGRLPTKEEMENDATAGGGCGYDADLCWTCTKGVDDSEHWVVIGRSTQSGTPEIRNNSSTAFVRFVADDDLNRPNPVYISDSVIQNELSINANKIEYSTTKHNQFSEVGISRGLVSWLPLIGDTKDRVTNDVATNNGATPVGDGYQFDGVDDYITLPNLALSDSTLMGWVNSKQASSSTGSSAGTIIGYYGGGSNKYLLISIDGSEFRWTIDDGTNSFAEVATSNFNINQWYHIAITYNSDGTTVAYLDSIVVGSLTSSTNVIFDSLPYNIAKNGSVYFNGVVSNHRIYNRALTPEEIAQEYNSGKASLNKNSAFAKEFIEV